MNKRKVLITLLTTSLLAVSQLAIANCQDNIVATTPDSDFTIHEDGTVTHNLTGLMWMRCSLGQTWDGEACTGSFTGTFDWQVALQMAEEHIFADYDDWRLPTKNELSSIIEERCYSPAKNTSIFSNSPTGWFYTSSPMHRNEGRVWSVDFLGGRVLMAMGPHGGRMRLVRDITD